MFGDTAKSLAICKKLLCTLYRLTVERTGDRAAFIEEHLKLDEQATAPLSEDDRRNERAMYASIFSDDCRVYVEGLRLEMLRELHALPFDPGSDLLSGLAILQRMIARALWKYDCNVGPTLEYFAREFDRLDRPEERHRLYEQAMEIIR